MPVADLGGSITPVGPTDWFVEDGLEHFGVRVKFKSWDDVAKREIWCELCRDPAAPGVVAVLGRREWPNGRVTVTYWYVCDDCSEQLLAHLYWWPTLWRT